MASPWKWESIIVRGIYVVNYMLNRKSFVIKLSAVFISTLYRVGYTRASTPYKLNVEYGLLYDSYSLCITL